MSAPIPVTPELLRELPLPNHREGEDKNSRGRVLVIGGSREVPGAALLAGMAALRAGAGKLQIAAPASLAAHLAIAMPEARVTGLDETAEGGLAPEEAARLAGRCAGCDVVVLGPGMMDPPATAQLTRRVLEEAEGSPGFVLDAGALAELMDCRAALRRHAGRLVLTPHAGEMARMLGLPAEQVAADPLGVARQAAAALGAVVVMKGGRSFVVSPQGEAWSCDRGNIGLATSGSGDTLAGIIGALVSRGAPPVTATLWGVFLHAEAGDRLARRIGPLGYLAREIPGEVPAIMGELAG
ncbi:NAD(P)H-hydrate dehydratase [Belnapia rosea]|uniref:ADP-dependent (S)-NAD(P)H-hydrate dehydratase n=1 Tax=Belnapia rosea TaxID=938405 RepID=A0A1G6THU9_9PROT|nr:NAD(P)H-hydrate dehydratase [Belnapia rosea]SDB68814.1 yjeF C-terminal region, hydroxyethylthiazole kinase-related [Belnapia rosea]SDD28650.1 yjeF C-terminal region, hydroxyethylthiazole kinase-related [Belnapia rosea]